MDRKLFFVVAAVAAACGGSSPSGPTPVTPQPGVVPPAQTFTLSGTIRDAATSEPVHSARVQFMTGVNAGRIARADDLGRYSLTELRAGVGTIRVYGPQHGPAERVIQITADLQADFGISRVTTLSPLPPYTYTGTVWDSRGSPVVGAAVTMIRDSGANPLGIVTTGGDGAFTITVQSSANSVRVARDGYVPRENPAPFALASTTVVNVTIARITRYALQAVQPLRVGETAILTTDVDTDDGLRSTGRAYTSTTSSNEAVIAIIGPGSILARAPGTATIAASYSGLSATITAQVLQ